MIYEVKRGEDTTCVRIQRHDDGSYTVQAGDGPPQGVTVYHGPDRMQLAVAGQRYDVGVVMGEQVKVDVAGALHVVDVMEQRRRALVLGGSAKEGSVATTMPGRVVRVLVKEGDAVQAGDPVVVVEAMKMENELKTEGPGFVSRVAAQTGDLVEAGTVLIEISKEA